MFYGYVQRFEATDTVEKILEPKQCLSIINKIYCQDFGSRHKRRANYYELLDLQNKEDCSVHYGNRIVGHDNNN